MRLRRHDLVDVAPEAWAEVAARLDLPKAAQGCVTNWVRLGRLAMVRRRTAGDRRGEAPLAIQLPNSLDRLKLALAAPTTSVVPRAPVALATAAISAPPAWTETIDGALALAPRFGMPTIYGGLLWQHVLAEPVLRETSDLDLLWRPAPEDRAVLVEALARLDRIGGPRLDGEILLEDGAGVAWRELAAALEGRTAAVAAKTLDGVELRDVGTVLRESVSC